jgi:transcription-repair coupling factor (superfamily II helicase)
MQFSLTVPAAGQAERISNITKGNDSRALAELALKLKQKSAKTPLAIITASAFRSAAPAGRNPLVCARFKSASTARLGNPALRPFSPHPDLISERLTTLYHITQNACDVIIVPYHRAALTSAKAYLAPTPSCYKKGQKLIWKPCASNAPKRVTTM